jgi:CheY-like chemotaxis protein/anti-sigma regulatory factor (Ser/Thr protein kinase)
MCQEAVQKAFSQKQSDFISHLCHELRNPLSSIFLLTENVTDYVQSMIAPLKKIECKEKASDMNLELPLIYQKLELIKNSLDEIKSCCQYEEDILNENLDVQKISEGKLLLNNNPMNIKEIVQNVAIICQAKATKKNLNFFVNLFVPDDLWVSSDALRIKQIIFNLLNNAIKFTHEGEITLTLNSLESTNDLHRFQIIVQDTGIGLKKEEINLLFSRYVQANLSIGSQYGGAGLGLYIAKQFSQLFNGDIKVESEEGKGARFTCEFECKTLSNEEKKSVSKLIYLKTLSPNTHEKKAPRLTHCRLTNILLVEDNEINVKCLSRLLEKEGYHCLIARNGKDAVALYKKSNSTFDAILMDTYMPIMTGLEATVEIRLFEKENSLPRKPIISLSGNALETDKTLAFEAGVDDYITKPFKREVILAKLINYIEQPTQSYPTSEHPQQALDNVEIKSPVRP